MSETTALAAPSRTLLTLPGEITETGWQPPEDLAWEQWLAAGAMLKTVERCVSWWAGDWLRFGERKFGERYAQAAEMFEYETQTLRNAVWVAEKFSPERRREKLPWSFHREVAVLPAPEADRLLEAAEKHGWTRRELHDYAEEARNPRLPGETREAPAAPAPEMLEASPARDVFGELLTALWDGLEQHFRETEPGTYPMMAAEVLAYGRQREAEVRERFRIVPLD